MITQQTMCSGTCRNWSFSLTCVRTWTVAVTFHLSSRISSFLSSIFSFRSTLLILSCSKSIMCNPSTNCSCVCMYKCRLYSSVYTSGTVHHSHFQGPPKLAVVNTWEQGQLPIVSFLGTWKMSISNLFRSPSTG